MTICQAKRFHGPFRINARLNTFADYLSQRRRHLWIYRIYPGTPVRKQSEGCMKNRRSFLFSDIPLINNPDVIFSA